MNDDLLAYISARRWFAGAAGVSTVTAVRVSDWLPGPGDPRTRIELVTIHDGTRSLDYQVPLTYRRERNDSLSHALVAEVEVGGVRFWAYDALVDPAGIAAVLRGLVDQGTIGTDDADLGVTFWSEDLDVAADAHAVSLGVEQSNSSLVVDEVHLLKVFRTVVPGRSPDVEVPLALQATDADSVVPVRGGFVADADGERYDLGVVQEFLRTATDGWDSARNSVRDLLGSVEDDPASAGGDWSGEAARLGVTVAHVHTAMARVFPTEPWSDQDLRRLAGRLNDRWDGFVQATSRLEEYTENARAVFERVAGVPAGVTATRVHGDLHLGQTLRSQDGWRLIDFEGEPGRPVAERTRLDSPLRDVAGMLRSFDYAAHSVLLQVDDDSSEATARTRAWVDRNRRAFLDGYGYGDADLPEAEAAILTAYELDKAAYEVQYELRHRPDWAAIPLAAVERLLGG